MFDFFGVGSKRLKYVHLGDIHRLWKVDVIALGSKYLELGNVLKEIMRERGMDPS